MNIVLVVIDTLRADHLSCYGYFRETSPTIDRLAKEGVLFENSYAAGIATGPGFTSIITGLYPIRSKYYITPWNVPNTYQLDDNIPVLAEILWDHRYTTAAFDNLINFRSHPKHFVRGYEYYVNVTRTSKWLHHHIIGRELNARLIPWIKQHAYEKFFLFIHYWDPHMPYNMPVGFDRVFRHKKGDLSDLKVVKTEAGYDYVPGWGKADEIFEGDEEKSIDLYDCEIFYVDHCLAQVINTLEDLRILDDTLIIITSDHGEQLGQHGLYGHAGLHEAVIKIPLIIRYPPKVPKGVRVKEYAQQVDIVPTILDLAGIKVDYQFNGESLMKLINGGKIREYAVSETWGERAIIDCDWKLIVHYPKELERPGPELKSIIELAKKKGELGFELYNIRKDPAEVINLADTEQTILDNLLNKLNEWIKAHLKPGEKDPMEELDKYYMPQPLEYQKLQTA